MSTHSHALLINMQNSFCFKHRLPFFLFLLLQHFHFYVSSKEWPTSQHFVFWIFKQNFETELLILYFKLRLPHSFCIFLFQTWIMLHYLQNYKCTAKPSIGQPPSVSNSVRFLTPSVAVMESHHHTGVKAWSLRNEVLIEVNSITSVFKHMVVLFGSWVPKFWKCISLPPPLLFWRSRQYVTSKRWYPFISLQGETPQIWNASQVDAHQETHYRYTASSHYLSKHNRRGWQTIFSLIKILLQILHIFRLLTTSNWE